MRYAIGVEWQEDGHTLAHVLDLPGCCSRGPAAQDALDRLFVAIPAYWAWLRGHGVAVPPDDLLEPVTLGVTEIARGPVPVDARDPGALFAVETDPPDAAQIALGLDRLAYCRADLLALLATVPPREWTEAPHHSTAIADQVWEIVAVELWTVGRLGPLPPLPTAASPLAALDTVRTLTVDRLTHLSADDCATTLILDEERWTVRKVLRRLLEYECGQVVALAQQLNAV